MKNSFFISKLVPISLLFLPIVSPAQWIRTNGLMGGEIQILAVSPNDSNSTNLFAVTFESVYRSTNNGANWTKADSGLNVDMINDFVITHNGTGVTTLFAGGSGPNSGAYLSTNNGTSWKSVNDGFAGTYIYIHSLAVSGSNVFAVASVTSKATVYLSTNNGSNWSAVNSGLPNDNVVFLAASGSKLFVSTLDSGNYRSTNNGSNWTKVGFTPSTLRSIVFTDTILFAGTSSNGVFVSTNNGENWKQISLINTSVKTLSFIPDSSGRFTLFACTNNGVFVSNDDGNNWTPFSIYANCIIKNDSNFFAGTENGVFLSTNNGANWNLIGAPGTSVTAITTMGSKIFAGVGGLFRSTNNGANWDSVNIELTNSRVNTFLVSGKKIFVGTSGGVYLSNDSGSNWNVMNTGLSDNDRSVHALAVFDTNLFAGTSGSVYYSTNNGVNWVNSGSGLPGNYLGYSGITSLAISSNEGDNHYIFAGNSKGVFRSTNNGSSWSAVNAGLTNLIVNALAARGTNIFAGTNGGVYRSTNNGSSWTSITNGSIIAHCFALCGTNLSDCVKTIW